MVCACMLLGLTSMSQKYGGSKMWSQFACVVSASCYLDCEAMYVVTSIQSYAGATLSVWRKTWRLVPRSAKISQSLN